MYCERVEFSNTTFAATPPGTFNGYFKEGIAFDDERRSRLRPSFVRHNRM